jgi:hypothetical protein
LYSVGSQGSEGACKGGMLLYRGCLGLSMLLN